MLKYTKESFTRFADPGHSWLKVPLAAIRACDLYITQDFSGYSYYRHDEKGGHVYLEEDCDAGIFLAAYYGKHGAMPIVKTRHCNGRSKIRGFERLPHGSRFNANMTEGRKVWQEIRQTEAA